MATNINDDEYSTAFYKAINDSSHSSAINTRMVRISETLLNANYLDGSLGEGANGKYDKDPFIRFDAFDCTTYVEAVLAGAMSASTQEFMPNLMKLRYKNGNISFVERNHFPSADWIPNNQDKLTDITADIAGDSLLIAETVIDKTAWYKKMNKSRLNCQDNSSLTCDSQLAQLQNEGSAFTPEATTLPYVPLTAVYLGINKDSWSDINYPLLDSIPSGSIINMVRPNWNLTKWIGTNMNVSHQSIAIRKEGQLYLRHASQTHKKVTDEDFITYFSKYLAGSSLKGFNVQILNP